MSKVLLCTLFPFYMPLTYFLKVEKTNFLAHNYILLLIHLDVMDNFGDDQ